MGNWILQGLTAAASDFEDSGLFGTNFIATFRLRYTPSLGAFKECPRLDWNETIMMNDHEKRETWTFRTNMYAHNPLSRTLEIWAKRYIEAYNFAKGQPFLWKGYSKLFDRNGVIVPGTAFAATEDEASMATAVRNYLKSHGGFLEIQIHDIPSINKPVPTDHTHKERLLLFNCGVEGGGPRVKAYQYLVVSSAAPKSAWTRQAGLGWVISGLKTTGFTPVPPPPGVAQPRPALFGSGECW
jgi:hypothetical protein